MIRSSLFLIVQLVSFTVFGQIAKTEEDFRTAFTAALDKSFTDKQLDSMFFDYRELLTPHSIVTRSFARVEGHEFSPFPLYDFKREKLYTDHINSLLNSNNPNQRILSYLVIASSFDTAKESILLEKIKTEKRKGNLTWAGMALLYLKTKHTTALFDFLVKHEDFGDAHMLPLFSQLDRDSLQQTAYDRIGRGDVKSKILAAQILAYTPLCPKTEEVLKQAVRTWDWSIKGYAIFSVKELQIGNLLETFKPLLDHKETRSISLEALANSPTEADRSYLIDLVNKQDTVTSELLDCFYTSKRIDNVRYWLKLLYTRPIPGKYIFFCFQQPLLSGDSILADLQYALQKVTNKDVLQELVRALKDRTDDKSIDIMISLLKHKSSTVRYWTAATLQTNTSEKLKTSELKDLINKGLKDGNNPDE
jgi:hypothetical protein